MSKPKLVPVDLTVAHPLATTTVRVRVLGEATANPHLIIAPCANADGALTGRFSLIHAPTGLAVRTGDVSNLRALADKISHLGWGTVERDTIANNPDMRQTVADAIRSVEMAVEPTGTELPAHDTWGPNGGGKGLPRQAVPLLRYLLDAAQRTFDRETRVPLNIPNPDKPGETKSNPEWFSMIEHRVDLYGLAYLLAALHRVDPEVSESAAASLADAWEYGDSIGEWVWQWREELDEGKPLTLYGIPAPVGDLLTPVS